MIRLSNVVLDFVEVLFVEALTRMSLGGLARDRQTAIRIVHCARQPDRFINRLSELQ